MKKVNVIFTFLLSIGWLIPIVGWAQPSIIESFSYTADATQSLEVQSAGVWTGSNSGVFVTEESLPYLGLTGTGNKISFQGNADGLAIAFDPTTGPPYAENIYYAFLFQVKSVPSSTSGDYFIRLNNGNAPNSIVPVYLRASENNPAKFNLGYGKRGLNTWLTDDLDANTTYYIVLSYSTSDTDPDPLKPNDAVKLWLNPPLSSFFSNIEPPYTSRVTGAASGNVTNTTAIKRVVIGHGDANKADMQIDIDEIRVGTTWSEMALLPVNDVAAGIYYIDSENGNDTNDGLSQTNAWKSLNKVNSSFFKPGSKLLFKAGGTWIGQLSPLGSGASGNPIVIDQYGTGSKPLFNGNGIVANGVVKLYNQSYWEINNLEIINDGPSNAERRGVEINGSNFGLISHIYLLNLEIHDIRGTIGGALSDKRSAGIYFTVTNDTQVPTRYDDILVEGCLIYNCQNQGIVTSNEISVSNYPGTPKWEERKITNLVIRNNIIHHISKNAMIIRFAEGGLVERNLCYETATGTTGNTIFSRSSRNTVFQYNEGYLNRALENGDYDGSMYDPDLNSPGTIWQYSYSHDNSDGLIVFCTDPRDDGLIVRYNISQNDKGDLVKINFPFLGAQIYNNTFYIGAGLKPVIIKEIEEDHTYTFQNNIVYNADANAINNPRYIFVDNKQNRTLTNNVFYRTAAPTQLNIAQNLTLDPMFVDPGKGSVGLNSVGGYQLKPSSPALNAGILIADNGGKDYFGNAVSSTNSPNIGFYNGPGTNSSSLPIELLYFTGKKNNEAAFLNWATASEKNNVRFIIERSRDGQSFIEAGKVEAAGNSSVLINYAFIDHNPYTGVNYYRLKQVDLNEDFTYSKNYIALDFGFPDEAVVSIYPNPVKESFSVKPEKAHPQPLQLIIYNLRGEKVSESYVDNGLGPVNQYVGFLSAGTYILEVRAVQTNKIVGTAKFLKY